MKRVIFYLLFLFFQTLSVYPQDQADSLHIKITDEKQNPIFGVYAIFQRHTTLLCTSDIDGECNIRHLLLQPSDTIQFQGIGYESVKRSFQELKKNPVVQLKALKYDLSEATVTGIPPSILLNIVCKKLKKKNAGRHPLCRHYGPAQYEKITQCHDTTVEYRREYGYYFTSGDIKSKNVWDQTYRSYMVPEYMARSCNLSIDGRDTLSPMFLTSEDIRFDIGTRKIFTLIRAIQLYGPLFSGIENYDIKPIESDSLDYTFSFKTVPSAYPDRTRISCKGIFVIDKEKQCLKKMTFDYIDYQLLRQILLSQHRKTTSPFSTKAELIFAYDSNEYCYIRSCRQQTNWKYNLDNNFILIEQPSRHRPGINRLVEKEAFHCYNLKNIPERLQTNEMLVKIHLAQRYPTGIYDPEIFQHLPFLLPTREVYEHLSRYIPIAAQFRMNNDKPYYPDNYILTSPLDTKSRKIYHQNLRATRNELFELFGNCQTK